MRIAVMSDSHGEETNLRWLLEQCWKLTGPIDAYIHLGDGAYDFAKAEKFIHNRDPQAKLIGVCGNNDYGMDLPTATVERFGGVRVFITHGHRYFVKRTFDSLDLAARQQNCSIALFGHTHQQWMEMRSILLLNPGSVMNDRMALIEIDEKGDIVPQLLEFS